MNRPFFVPTSRASGPFELAAPPTAPFVPGIGSSLYDIPRAAALYRKAGTRWGPVVREADGRGPESEAPPRATVPEEPPPESAFHPFTRR